MNPIWLNAVRASGGVPWWLAGGAPEPSAAYQPIGAASLAASLVDLSGNGNDATAATPPLHSAATGWQYPGNTSAVVVSPVVPTSAYAVIVLFEIFGTGGGGAGRLIDTGGGSPLRIIPNNAGTDVSYTNGSSNLLVAPQIPNSTRSTLAIAGETVYRNGTIDGVITVGSVTANPISIGNILGIRQLFGNIQAVAIYPTSLDHTTWVPAVSAAMAAL